MNAHYCRVGTIRPNDERLMISKGLKHYSVKTENKTGRYKSKLSK